MAFRPPFSANWEYFTVILLKFMCPGLSEQQVVQARALLSEYAGVFAFSDNDLGVDL